MLPIHVPFLTAASGSTIITLDLGSKASFSCRLGSAIYLLRDFSSNVFTGVVNGISMVSAEVLTVDY